MNDVKLPPPFPRMGEIFRFLALALDTKSKNREVDRYAREGEIDWSLPNKLKDELFLQPIGNAINSKFAHFFCEELNSFFQNYISLISEIELSSMKREDALPFLIEHFFIKEGSKFLLETWKRLEGPSLSTLFKSNTTATKIVFEWFNAKHNLNIAKVAFPETTGSDKVDRESVSRWCNGTQIADLSSLKRLAKNFSKNNPLIDQHQTAALKCWLILARAIDWIQENFAESNIKQIILFTLITEPKQERVEDILKNAVKTKKLQFIQISACANRLFETLTLRSNKELGLQEKLKRDIAAFEDLLIQQDKEGLTHFYRYWAKGRWNALSGLYEEAEKNYEVAISMANYRAGNLQKEILKETLALAGHLRSKSLLNRLKHQAVALRLFKEPQNSDMVENWEIEQFEIQFTHIFPAEGFFPETSKDKLVSPKFPFLVFDIKNIQERKPDLKSPDRVATVNLLDGQKRQWPQLRLFASFGMADAVKQLLEANANVNQLDKQGGSALLCAIQHARDTGDCEVLNLLLQVSHTKETLDSLTEKKQISPLFEAIDYGDPDVVESLLNMGASPNIRGLIIGHTPLYYTLERISCVKNPTKFRQILKEQMWDLELQETMRRFGILSSGIYGDKDGLTNLLNDPQKEILFLKTIGIQEKAHVKRHSESKLLEIIGLLLSHGANPNAAIQYPVQGRTPIMMATEANSAEAFELLLKNNADPFQKDSFNQDCRKLAVDFRCYNIINFMQIKGII